jgi:hypothetical protein
MRAMVFDRYGEPDIMSLRDIPVPAAVHKKRKGAGG